MMQKKKKSLYNSFESKLFCPYFTRFRETVANLSAEPEHCDDFSERICYYQDNEIHKKEGTKPTNVIYFLC